MLTLICLHVHSLYVPAYLIMVIREALWCSGKAPDSRSWVGLLADLIPASTKCCVLGQDVLFTLLSNSFCPANRKRYHNVFIWLYESLIATQRCVSVTMMFAIRTEKVMLKPTINKRYLNVRLSTYWNIYISSMLSSSNCYYAYFAMLNGWN